MKIAGIGNALMDVLVNIGSRERVKELGLTINGMTLIDKARAAELQGVIDALEPQIATGGSAGNTVLALSHLGVPSSFIGCVGRDEMGARLRSRYVEAGLDTHIIESDEPTGVAHTFITEFGERSFATFLGASSLMTPADITEERLRGSDLLHIEGYLVEDHDLMEHIVRTAKGLGMTLTLDLASYDVVRAHRDFFRHILADYIDIVFANEMEAEAFARTCDTLEAIKELGTLCDTAVVKCGRDGAYYRQGRGSGWSAARPIAKVVDTTAAGDFFAAGYLYGVAQGVSNSVCLRLGNLVASYVIQVVGTQVSETMWEQIRADLQKEIQR